VCFGLPCPHQIPGIRALHGTYESSLWNDFSSGIIELDQKLYGLSAFELIMTRNKVWAGDIDLLVVSLGNANYVDFT
jgi:hypothetical protein